MPWAGTAARNYARRKAGGGGHIKFERVLQCVSDNSPETIVQEVVTEHPNWTRE